MDGPFLKLLVALPTLIGAGPGPGLAPQPLVLSGVTVIDATGTAAQPGMTVVIAGGRIANVGKTGQVTVPSGSRLVDASGKYLIPGLWDMHVHWYDRSSLPLFTVNGVTGIRIMCGFPLHLQWRTEIAAGRLVGLRLVLAGPIIDGPDPVWPDSLRAADRPQGELAVRTIRQEGYDCVKVYNLLPRRAYLGVAEEARKLKLPLVGHVPFDISAAEASDAGQKSIEHLSGVSLACSSRETQLRKEMTAALRDHAGPETALLLRFEVLAEDSYDHDKASALFARFVANGTWQVPTLTMRQTHALLEDRTARTGPRFRYLPPALKARWDRRRAATFRKLGPQDFANFRASLKKQLEVVGRMHGAGVRFLAGTDTGSLDCLPGWSLHDELELLVRAGLTPLEALQAATRNPAEYLGRLSEQGTIERGKRADLVLLDADPLADIRNTRKIRAVVVDGRLLGASDLQAMLAEVESACRQQQGEEKFPGAFQKYP
jgi:imidazolonepropionase-like amidohydrolase